MKRFGLVIMVMCFVVGLSGCSSGIGKSSDNTLSGSFSPKHDSIWYYVDAEDVEVGKDTEISRVFVFKEGKFKVYRNTQDDITLGYVAQTGDDELIAKLEEDKKENEIKMRAYLDKAKAGCDLILASSVFTGDQQRFANDVTYNFSADKGIFDTISKSLVSYTIPEPGQEIRFGVKTDSTGNTVDSEIIAFREVQVYSNPSLYGELGKVVDVKSAPSDMVSLMTQFLSTDTYGGQVNYSKGLENKLLSAGTADITKPMSSVCPEHTTSIVVTNALDPTRGAIKVYDTTYTGYICDEYLLLTDADGKSFVMDDLKKSGLVIDPKEEDLFK